MTPIEQIQEIQNREFGFMRPGVGKKLIMERHLRFVTSLQLRERIAANNNVDCFVSVATYDDPVHMSGWLGADLFFDIDNKDNLALARADAETVYEVLIDDFALKEVSLRFSGAKGYHVIATDERPRILGSKERREIVDYMTEKYNVVSIDAPVSGDVKRLRRIAGTINSKSGKYCKVLRVSNGEHND